MIEEGMLEIDEVVEKRKNNITDMYWLINQKLFDKEKLIIDENSKEVGLLTLGFNADFGNLRIGFYDITEESFTTSSMIKDKMELLSTINFFSETCQNILYHFNNNLDMNINNFERIIGCNNKWIANQSRIVGNKENLIIKTKTPSGNVYSFTFYGFQIKSLISALNFMVNGDSWKIYLEIHKK